MKNLPNPITLLLESLPENNRLERMWKLAQIDFNKRYYNDKLGVLWALLNPLIRIGVYFVIFSMVFQSREENFIIFLFCGILIWTVFTESTSRGMQVLKSKQYLIESIQFNHIDLFLSHVISVFLGFSFNFAVYIIFALFFGVSFDLNLIYVPIIFLTLFFICVGMSMILATISIYLEDIKHLWSIIVFIGFWSSGVLFSADKILEKIPILEYLNPFLGLLTNARNVLVYSSGPNLFMLIYCLVFSTIIFLIGILLYNRYSYLAMDKI